MISQSDDLAFADLIKSKAFSRWFFVVSILVIVAGLNFFNIRVSFLSVFAGEDVPVIDGENFGVDPAANLNDPITQQAILASVAAQYNKPWNLALLKSQGLTPGVPGFLRGIIDYRQEVQSASGSYPVEDGFVSLKLGEVGANSDGYHDFYVREPIVPQDPAISPDAALAQLHPPRGMLLSEPELIYHLLPENVDEDGGVIGGDIEAGVAPYVLAYKTEVYDPRKGFNILADEGEGAGFRESGCPLGCVVLEVEEEEEENYLDDEGEGSNLFHGKGTGLDGYYCDHMDRCKGSGRVAFNRLDPNVNFVWGQGSPGPGVGDDFFGVEWYGYIEVPSDGNYTFDYHVDETGSLMLGGVNNDNVWLFHDDGPGQLTDSIFLEGGRYYDLYVDVIERQGDSQARLHWTHPGGAEWIPPEVLYLEGNRPPLVQNHPADVNTVEGQDLVLRSCGIQGTHDISNDPMQYEWYINGQQIAASQNVNFQRCATLDLSPVKPSDSGIYHMIARNGSGQDQTRDIQVSVEAIPWGRGSGIRATHFADATFKFPIYTQVVPTINFDWGTGKPHSMPCPQDGVRNDMCEPQYFFGAPPLSENGFGVAYTADLVVPYPEDYTFYVKSDDGVRIWLDNKIIFDSWYDDYDDWARTDPVSLIPGQRYEFLLEYFDNKGDANVLLEWESNRVARGTIPASQWYQTSYQEPDVNILEGQVAYVDAQGRGVITVRDLYVSVESGLTEDESGLPGFVEEEAESSPEEDAAPPPPSEPEDDLAGSGLDGDDESFNPDDFDSGLTPDSGEGGESSNSAPSVAIMTINNPSPLAPEEGLIPPDPVDVNTNECHIDAPIGYYSGSATYYFEPTDANGFWERDLGYAVSARYDNQLDEEWERPHPEFILLEDLWALHWQAYHYVNSPRNVDTFLMRVTTDGDIVVKFDGFEIARSTAITPGDVRIFDVPVGPIQVRDAWGNYIHHKFEIFYRHRGGDHQRLKVEWKSMNDPPETPFHVPTWSPQHPAPENILRVRRATFEKTVSDADMSVWFISDITHSPADIAEEDKLNNWQAKPPNGVSFDDCADVYGPARCQDTNFFTFIFHQPTLGDDGALFRMQTYNLMERFVFGQTVKDACWIMKDPIEAKLNVFDSPEIEDLVITKEPSWPEDPIELFIGESHDLSVEVFGTPGFTYQWQADFGAGFRNLDDGYTESDDSTDVYTVNFEDGSEAGFYRVVVTDSVSGPFESDAAQIIERDPDDDEDPPNIPEHEPEDAYNIPGDGSATVEFIVNPTGKIPMTFEWLFDSDHDDPDERFVPHPLGNETSNVLRIPNVIESDQGFYMVKVTNENGTSDSIAAYLEVLDEECLGGCDENEGPPVIAEGFPRNATITIRDGVRESVTLSATATGEPPLTYKWGLKNRSGIFETQASGVDMTEFETDVSGTYRLTVENNFNGYSRAFSRQAEVDQEYAGEPWFVIHPEVEPPVYEGDDVILRSDARGAGYPGNIRYQWYKLNGNDWVVPDLTKVDGTRIRTDRQDLDFGPVQTTHTGHYRVKAVGPGGEKDSIIVLLDVIGEFQRVDELFAHTFSPIRDCEVFGLAPRGDGECDPRPTAPGLLSILSRVGNSSRQNRNLVNNELIVSHENPLLSAVDIDLDPKVAQFSDRVWTDDNSRAYIAQQNAYKNAQSVMEWIASFFWPYDPVVPDDYRWPQNYGTLGIKLSALDIRGFCVASDSSTIKKLYPELSTNYDWGVAGSKECLSDIEVLAHEIGHTAIYSMNEAMSPGKFPHGIPRFEMTAVHEGVADYVGVIQGMNGNDYSTADVIFDYMSLNPRWILRRNGLSLVHAASSLPAPVVIAEEEIQYADPHDEGGRIARSLIAMRKHIYDTKAGPGSWQDHTRNFDKAVGQAVFLMRPSSMKVNKYLDSVVADFYHTLVTRLNTISDLNESNFPRSYINYFRDQILHEDGHIALKAANSMAQEPEKIIALDNPQCTGDEFGRPTYKALVPSLRAVGGQLDNVVLELWKMPGGGGRGGALELLQVEPLCGGAAGRSCVSLSPSGDGAWIVGQEMDVLVDEAALGRDIAIGYVLTDTTGKQARFFPGDALLNHNDHMATEPTIKDFTPITCPN